MSDFIEADGSLIQSLRTELVAAKADADLRWENGFQNAKLQFEARIRELEAKLQHWLNAYGSTDAISSDTRDLLRVE